MSILLIVSLLIGIITGVITFIFGSGLNFITGFIVKAFPYNLILLPLVGFITVYLRNMRFTSLNGSMSQIFYATKKDKKVSVLVVPYQLLTTWLAHLAGTSVGREGVAVQLGAATANYLSDKFPKLDRTQITRTGMAAGFAGLFGTPLAATFFCFEVTRKKTLDWKSVVSTLIAAYTANFTSAGLGLNHFHIDVKFVVFSSRELLFFIFSVTMFALLGHAFAFGLKKLKKMNAALKIKEQYKIMLLAIIGGLLLFGLHEGRYMSLGTNIIDDAFNNPQNILLLDPIIKAGLTMYFVAIGFQGGEVTPLFAMGSSLGVILAYYFGLPMAMVAAVGYAFTFGNATNAYTASAVLCVEVFGIGTIPYVIIALGVTYLIKNDTHSIYPQLEWE